tara:strand:- start:128870 stop:129751 length:882 start_codon:yes stop_codon:yes gene_type:complete
VDYVFSVDLSAVRADSKQRADDPAIVIGGQCVNAVVTLAALGAQVSYAGVVGAQASGDLVMQFLHENRIDLRAVERAAGLANPCAYIFVDRKTGERSIVETQAADFPAFSGEIDEAIWAETSYLYFDGHEIEASVALAREAAIRGVATMTDIEVLSPQTTELISLVETSIVPKGVASEIAGSDKDVDMLAALAELGGSCHVVTMGDQGAIGALHGGEVFRVPAVPCQVVDTTGAGDAFHAGFLYADMAGASLQKSMMFAARVASIACTFAGPSAPSYALSSLSAIVTNETWIS